MFMQRFVRSQRAEPVAPSFGFVGALVLAISMWSAACSSEVAPLLCGEIPTGGCPVGRGGTCDDHECRALYDCVDGSWTALEACEARLDAGVDDAAASDSGCTPTGIGEGDGGAGAPCPDLQVPDCSVAIAGACAEQACLTECTDFFRCDADGWIAVAYCDDSGQLHAVP